MSAGTSGPASLSRMEAWGGAMLRAVTGDASLQWSGQTLYRGTTPIPQAAAHHSQVPVQQTDQRGLLDSMGLRLHWSDQALFQAHLPQDPAVRDGELHEVKSPLILQPGPAALSDGVQALAEIFHGWAARRQPA